MPELTPAGSPTGSDTAVSLPLERDSSPFDARSDMGALMRTIDWTATPLGAPEHWPQSLRTAVSICLESRFPILVWWGPQLVKIYNDAYRQVLGTKHPASMGAEGRRVWPEIWHIIGPMLEGVMSRGEATWSEDTMLHMIRKGFLEETYFTFSYSPIRDETGGIGGIFTAVTETTRRVLGERRLAILRTLGENEGIPSGSPEQACRRAAEVLEKGVNDIPFARVYLFDGSGEPRLAAVSGAPASADERWPVRDVAASREPRPLRVAEHVDGTLTSTWGDDVRDAVALPLLRATQDTPYGMLILGVSPRLEFDDAYRDFFNLVAGQIAGSIATASAYEEERQRAEALLELDRAKTAFFSNVSHEFRTPITLILGPLSDLLAQMREDAPQRETLAVINRNALRLLKLVNTLLDFSRIEAGRIEAHYVPVALEELTAELASSFRSTVERAGLTLEVSGEPLPRRAYVDVQMWEKIVLNLLSNAFKHTFDGGIRVDVRAHGEHAVLRVSDTGVGIPATDVQRVFDRFHRVAATRSRTHEGSGIGLSLVRELVHLHGGTARVESTVGSGTMFEVTIPLGHAHLPAEHVSHRETSNTPASPGVGVTFAEEASRWGAPAVTSDEYAVPAGPAAMRPLAGANILVADDNADMRDYLTRLLRQAGAHVTTATNGKEALDRVRESPAPDVVLSDVMMPLLDGFGLLAALRAEDATRAIPFVMLSARAGEESRVGGLTAGADEYLVKPFLASELIARVTAQYRLGFAAAAERAARGMADEARAQMARVFEQAPIPICVVEGHELLYTSANAHYRQVIGGRDPVGKTLLELWPELDGSEIQRVFRQVLATGEAYSATEFPIRFDQFGTGEVHEAFFNFVYHPLHDAAGRTHGLMAVATDVTPQVLARREAERLKALAESASDAKSQLLRTVSHETRQPVHASLGYLDILMMELRGTLTAGQRADLERIRRNQSHLLGLLNDILSYAKLEAGALELDIVTVNAGDVISALEPLVTPQFRSKGVAYEARAGEPLLFRADSDRAVQVCLNLLTNALKATPAGGRVTIWADADDDMVRLHVSDTGVGIPASKLEAIFDPFTQLGRTHNATEASGVGLGLSICRQLARAMAGDVTVRSEPGKGSTFTFSLPRA